MNKNYVWANNSDTSDIVHPLCDRMYITYDKNNNYIYFNIPFFYGGKYYSNHFSVGEKDYNVKNKARKLIDLHYTMQDVVGKESQNIDKKCWLYDGKLIDINDMSNCICEIPRKLKMGDVFSPELIDFITKIISAPFMTVSSV